jgi:hypothetical protein
MSCPVFPAAISVPSSSLHIANGMQQWHNEKTANLELILRLSSKAKQLHHTTPAYFLVEKYPAR